jgi:hypothetical protein
LREAAYVPQTGRYAYLGPDERPDGPEDMRSRIVYRHPFWKDEEERLRYERASQMLPVKAYSSEVNALTHMEAIIEVAKGLKPGEAVKAMPKVGVNG